MTAEKKKFAPTWIKASIVEIFGLDRRVAAASTLFAAAAAAFAVFWFFHSAPPMSIAITTGPEGGSYRKSAEKYAAILKKSGVELRILPSEGSLQNLKRLEDPASGVDVGFVPGGEADERHKQALVSLGSVNHQPMLIFYRAGRPVHILSEFAGQRLAVGPEGSGTRVLSLALLADNGIKPGGATRLDGAEAAAATKSFLAGKLDAIFLMGDSAPSDVIRLLLRDKAVRLYSFTQADGYVRRRHYLNKMVLPRGAIDFGEDIPSDDVDLIGPTVDLVTRPDFDPALTDLLLEAAQEVHGGPGLFRDAGDFPSSQEREFRLSPAAAHFYKSGKGFFQKLLPFWVASFVDRILVSLVPLLVILIPGLKAIPFVLRWRINLMIYRWYRMLLKVEHEIAANLTKDNRQAFLDHIDRIEEEVNRMNVPVTYATQFYELRGHIGFVRGQITGAAV